jgi:hypothetical protein
VFRCALPGETEDKKQNAVRIASTLADTWNECFHIMKSKISFWYAMKFPHKSHYQEWDSKWRLLIFKMWSRSANHCYNNYHYHH